MDLLHRDEWGAHVVVCCHEWGARQSEWPRHMMHPGNTGIMTESGMGRCAWWRASEGQSWIPPKLVAGGGVWGMIARGSWQVRLEPWLERPLDSHGSMPVEWRPFHWHSYAWDGGFWGPGGVTACGGLVEPD